MLAAMYPYLLNFTPLLGCHCTRQGRTEVPCGLHECQNCWDAWRVKCHSLCTRKRLSAIIYLFHQPCLYPCLHVHVCVLTRVGCLSPWTEVLLYLLSHRLVCPLLWHEPHYLKIVMASHDPSNLPSCDNHHPGWSWRWKSWTPELKVWGSTSHIKDAPCLEVTFISGHLQTTATRYTNLAWKSEETQVGTS